MAPPPFYSPSLAHLFHSHEEEKQSGCSGQQWTAVDSSGKELCIERGAHLKAGVQVRPGSYSLHFHNVGVVNVTVHSEEAAKDLFDVFLECRWEWLIWAMRYWVNRWVWISGMIRTERYSVHEQPQTITYERVQIPAVFCHTPF